MCTLKLRFPSDDYLNDLHDTPNAFYPYLKIDANSENTLTCSYKYDNGYFSCNISSNLWGEYSDGISIFNDNSLVYKKLTKRLLKNSLYNYLSKNLEIVLPYGSLTGVRPTKFFRDLANETNNPKEYLKDAFSVSQSRLSLIEQCVEYQKDYINKDCNNIGLFLNVPFCPSRCNYCTFISTEVFRIKKELPLYLQCVKLDTECAKQIINEKNFNVSSVYVGGGTPSSVGSVMLDKMLKPLSNYGVEFTVEIGRPDTINVEILDVLKQNNVTRISINPQSFHQKTLDKIGRKHTVEQIYQSYEMAKKYGFQINMDFIAFPDESFDEFCYSINKAVELSPDNITIHTLSLKRGSVLTIEGGKKVNFGLAEKKVNFAYDKLKNNSYFPYYMYRQKNMSDNLENVGFCKSGKQCNYNIDTMEESASIIGIGCGAMSKLVESDKIKRFFSQKGFREYCDRIEKTVVAKRDFYLI